jgi:hypothetical protein
MKYLLLVALLLLTPFAKAEGFDPQYLVDANITHRGACNRLLYCLKVEKDGYSYLQVISAGQIILIFLIVDEKTLALVWGRDMI